MLTKLTLTDFKRHSNLVVDLTEGLTLISGPNYSGKTTILQGIMYALWGPSAIPGGTSVVTRRGGKKAKVELEFPHNGDIYAVTRSGNSVAIAKNGETVAKSASAVNSYLTEMLGIDKKRFSQLRYSKQGETQALLTLGAGEIHNIIEELSGVAVVNEIAAKAKTISVKELAMAEAKQVSGLEQKQERMATLAKELKKEMTSIVSLKEQHSALKDEFSKAQEAYHSAVKNNEVAAKIASDLRDIDTKIKNATDRVCDLRVELDRVPGLVEELEGVETVSSVLSGELMEANEVAAYLTLVDGELPAAEHVRDAALQAAEDTYYAAGEASGPTDEHLATLKKAVEDAAELRADAKAAYKAALQVLNDGKCPTCGAPYDDCDDDAEEKAEKLKEAAAVAIRTHTNAVGQLDIALKDLAVSNELANAHNEAEAKLDAAKIAVKDLERKISDSNLSDCKSLPTIEEVGPKALAKKRKELDDLLQDSARLKAAIEAAEVTKSTIKTLEERINGYESEKSKIGGIPEKVDLAPLKETAKEISKELDATATTVNRMNGAYAEKHAAYIVLKAEIKSEEARKKESQEHATASRVAAELAKYLTKNRDRFMSAAWTSIMSGAAEFAGACTGGEISSVNRSEKGDFTYTENGEVMPIEAASGAQKSIIGLGVQMAMSKLMPGPVNTLLLDEVTADMDAEKSLALSAVVKANGGQVLMVSHRELDGSSAENVISLGSQP